MALPAYPTSPASPFQSPAEWFAEHSQRNHRNTPRGQKRRLDDDADTAPAISNGFKKLRISPPRPPRQHEYSQPANVDLHYTQQRTSSPISAYQAPPVTVDRELIDAPIHPEPTPSTLHHPQPLKYRNQLLPDASTCDTPPPQRLPSNHEDFMPVEDNRHRIFISDLDAAIAEIEAEERAAKEKEQERAFFLPDDVDKEVSGIPDQVLRTATDSTHSPVRSQALVLYRDPLSFSVPEDVDAVRKAVREARQRIRERSNSHSGEDAAQTSFTLPPEPPSPMDHEGFGYPLDRQQSEWRHNSDASTASELDPDAMEIE